MVENVYFPQTQYFGSKEKLGSFIVENVDKYIGLKKINSVFDAFSGSAYVGYIFKLLNKKVIGNDYLKFNFHVGNSLIVNNKRNIETPAQSSIWKYQEVLSGAKVAITPSIPVPSPKIIEDLLSCRPTQSKRNSRFFSANSDCSSIDIGVLAITIPH